MRANLLAAAVILGVGCTTAEPPAPKVGAKVVMPKFDTIHATADAARSQPGKRPREIGAVQPGDLVEVLEVSDGVAAINVIRDFRGDPGKVHGFVKRWW